MAHIEVDRGLCEVREVHAGSLPIVSARTTGFTMASDENDPDSALEPPSIEDILAQLESDELHQLEKEDRAALERSRFQEAWGRPLAHASDTTHSTQCSTPCVELNDEAESSGLPVMSRSALASTLLKRESVPPVHPAEQETSLEVEQSCVPPLDELLGRLDGEIGSDAGSSTLDDHSIWSVSSSSRWEAERRIADAVQAHPDQQQWGFHSRVGMDKLHSSQMIIDMRNKCDSQFQEADDSSWLPSEASYRNLRSVHKPEICAEEEKEPETWSSHMQDLLRGPQKKLSRPKGQDPKMMAKPPNQRTECLPGVRMAGAKPSGRKPAKTTSQIKRIEDLKKMLRHANAGGSLDTLFEEDDDPDAKIPDCDLLFGGRALQCSAVPQVFTCVSDAQCDDWIPVPHVHH